MLNDLLIFSRICFFCNYYAIDTGAASTLTWVRFFSNRIAQDRLQHTGCGQCWFDGLHAAIKSSNCHCDRWATGRRVLASVSQCCHPTWCGWSVRYWGLNGGQAWRGSLLIASSIYIPPIFHCIRWTYWLLCLFITTEVVSCCSKTFSALFCRSSLFAVSKGYISWKTHPLLPSPPFRPHSWLDDLTLNYVEIN